MAGVTVERLVLYLDAGDMSDLSPYSTHLQALLTAASPAAAAAAVEHLHQRRAGERAFPRESGLWRRSPCRWVSEPGRYSRARGRPSRCRCGWPIVTARAGPAWAGPIMTASGWRYSSWQTVAVSLRAAAASNAAATHAAASAAARLQPATMPGASPLAVVSSPAGVTLKCFSHKKFARGDNHRFDMSLPLLEYRRPRKSHYRIAFRKVSPGRQFTGRNLPRPARGDFCGEIFYNGTTAISSQ